MIQLAKSDFSVKFIGGDNNITDIALNDNTVVFKITVSDDTDSFCISYTRPYTVFFDINIKNEKSNFGSYETNGFSPDYDTVFFGENTPQINFNLSNASARFFEISFKIIDIAKSPEHLSMLLSASEQQAYELKSLEDKYREAKTELEGITKEYIDVLNSFYWRFLAFPRKITTKLVLWVRKHAQLSILANRIKKGLRLGPVAIIKYFIRKLKERKPKVSYKISAEQRKIESTTVFDKPIKISILVPLYNTPKKYLVQMIESVRNQTYSHWELCLADGSTSDFSFVENICRQYITKDERIKYKKLEKNLGISANTNACIQISTGDYIGLFDHDDLLHPSALFEVVTAICDKNADFIYTDEVTFFGNNTNKIYVYNFKPDYSPDTLRSYNYICHFTVFSRELMKRAGGGFNSRFDGSQDYDLILRLTEKAENIIHIPKALYFWRSHKASTASSISAKPYIIEAAHAALEEHLKRIGLNGSVGNASALSTYRIKYKINGHPLVSIIIPNKDHIDDLDKCISSIISKSSYRNFEIIVVENNSTESETFEYYKKLEKHKNVKIVYWKKAFNYSAINNFGAQYAQGDYLLLLNNDVEVINHDWLEEMLMFAQRSDVGAVGAKLYFPDDTVQHAGVILGIGGIAGHSHKHLPRRELGYMARASIVQNLSACTAACLMIRKDVFEQVGGIDESYAVAFNDVDLCMKIREAGYLIVFTPYSELYHYESKSRGFEDTPEKVIRFNSEIERFKSRWGEQLESGDPYYNPNLTLIGENFDLK